MGPHRENSDFPTTDFAPEFTSSGVAPSANQVGLSIKKAILEGRLPPGHRLKPTRIASQHWGLPRRTILEAYAILIAEGFVTGRHGSGTYVTSNLPARPPQSKSDVPANAEKAKRPDPAVTSTGTLEAPILDPRSKSAFATGRVFHDERTALILTRIAKRNPPAFELNNSQRELALRSSVVAFLSDTRGVRCTVDQIFITSGIRQSLDLAFRVLLRHGSKAVVENPCYPPARRSLAINGAKVVSLPVDRDGLVADEIARLAPPSPELFFVTPSNQYPTGATLSLSRRLALLDYACQNDSWIVEYDNGHEFRYEGRSAPSLQGLDDFGRVVSIGGFSETLPETLRIGYVIAPRSLVHRFKVLISATTGFTPAFQQYIVADFLGGGHFPAHLRRSKELTRKSRDILVHFLNERLSRHLEVTVPAQGTYLTARLKAAKRPDTAIADDAQRKGVAVLPVSPMYVSGKGEGGLLLGFSGLSEEEADFGTDILRASFERI